MHGRAANEVCDQARLCEHDSDRGGNSLEQKTAFLRTRKSRSRAPMVLLRWESRLVINPSDLLHGHAAWVVAGLHYSPLVERLKGLSFL